ncbi:MAG: N-acetylmuramoyl-L-alanine amidase [Mycobacteriales bacterium]
MLTFRKGDRAPAVAQVRAWLRVLGILPPGEDTAAPGPAEVFDTGVHRAVMAFQQQRGLRVDGVVGPETFRALEEARWQLGDRPLYYQVGHPYVGDDVLALQRRLWELGFDAGRCDGVFGPRTEGALKEFQRNYGLHPDGRCGPLALRALRQLQRSVVGGRPLELREAEALRRRGPALAGKAVVVDPGHGADDTGWLARGLPAAALSERDLVADLARRLEGRLAAAGVSAYLTHGPDSCPTEEARAMFANDTGADLVVSLHTDGHSSPVAQGVATYFFGQGPEAGSAVGRRFADLVQREIVHRTDFLDAGVHPKTWELLRLTRMPAIRIELGYLTNPGDAARLAAIQLRETVAEAVLVAVQRLFLPREQDPPTGELRLPLLAPPLR